MGIDSLKVNTLRQASPRQALVGVSGSKTVRSSDSSKHSKQTDDNIMNVELFVPLSYALLVYMFNKMHGLK